MGRANSRSILSQSIAEVLGTAVPSGTPESRPGPLRKSLIYASMALLIINPAQVNAIGLGEMQVNSRIGQPLDATVPVTLGSGESLPKDCVAPTRGNGGLGTPANVNVSTPAATQPGTYSLRVTSANALHEPMYEISLVIDCPGTPVLLRQYVLMLDLPGMPAATTTRGDTLSVPVTGAIRTATPLPSRAVAAATRGNSVRRSARTLQRTRTPIPAGQPYRVSEGDTLSTIAARIDGRLANTTWQVANRIFEANPNAFIRGNPDMIKLGSLIEIPSVPELAELGGSRTPAMPPAAATRATMRATTSEPSLPAPQPAPMPAPVVAPATTGRAESFATQPEPVVPTLPTDMPVADTAFVETPAPFIDAQPQPTPFEADAVASDAVAISPFIDEQPVAPTATAGSPETAMPAPVAAAPAAPTITATAAPVVETESVNPLLAILVGILLGALASFVTLRRRLVDTLTALLRRRSPDADAEPSARGSNRVGSFDTSVADSAFATRQQTSEALPISAPAESTYIVETSAAEQTGSLDAFDDSAADIEADLEADLFGIEADENVDNDMLAMLFDDDPAAAGPDCFDPTGGVDADATGTFAGPTAEMPIQPRPDEGFDPTAELAAEFNDEMFDPTTEMPSGQPDFVIDEDAEASARHQDDIETSLRDALDNTIEDIDPDKMFATSSNLSDDFDDASPTAEAPEATIGDLNALQSYDDEDGLSETLHEALSLLERDFEEEFTASQILERSEINRSLEKTRSDDEPRAADDEHSATPTRKVSS